MKWHIFDNSDGKLVGVVEAKTAREALVKYLLEHEELDDVMLWKSCDRDNSWRLAPYDEEENFMYARLKIEAENVWDLYMKIPHGSNLKLLNKSGKVLVEDYGSSVEDTFDDAKIITVNPDPHDSDLYNVVIEEDNE